ncbi:MAG: hypothetical protein NUV53_00890 [Patescibacteria group bacterium]|nr:hypothetical protein [Patescibacteria group bacterium]
MSIKKISSFVAVGIVAFMIGSGARYLSAQTFNAPTQTPPSENVPAPINVGSITQTKIGGLNLEGNFAIKAGSSEEWAFDVQRGSLRLGSAQAWGPDGTVMIGSVPENWSNPSGVVLNINGGVRIQGGNSGDVLTNKGGGVASWEKPVAPVTSILAGSYITVTPSAGGVVTVSAIQPSAPDVPGWVNPGSGSSNRVPVADSNGNVSWRVVRAVVSGGGSSSIDVNSAYESIRQPSDPLLHENGIDRAVYHDSSTLNRICVQKGYERYVGGGTFKIWTSPEDNGVVAWGGSQWVKYDGDNKEHVEGAITCETTGSARLILE